MEHTSLSDALISLIPTYGPWIIFGIVALKVTGRAFENGPLAMGQVSFSPSLVEYLAQKFAEVDGQLKGANNLS
jgi:hypothetical protein